MKPSWNCACGHDYRSHSFGGGDCDQCDCKIFQVDQLGIENVQLSQRLAYTTEERDHAWTELRAIREAINADPEESTLDEVRRIMAVYRQLVDAKALESRPRVRSLLGTILSAAVHPNARCPQCVAGQVWLTSLLSQSCEACNGTGRRHKNGKPVYHLSEVQEFLEAEREPAYEETTCCGFPGGMNQP